MSMRPGPGADRGVRAAGDAAAGAMRPVGAGAFSVRPAGGPGSWAAAVRTPRAGRRGGWRVQVSGAGLSGPLRPPSPSVLESSRGTEESGTRGSAPPGAKGVIPYVPLHVHTHNSLLDGASTIPSLVAKASRCGMPAVAVTDHGVMFGAVELLRCCRGTAVKGIVGNEMYMLRGDRELADIGTDPLWRAKGEDGRRARQYHHVTVLAKNLAGYRNLSALTSVSNLEGSVGAGIFKRPCISKSLLKAHAEGLVVLSGCMSGEIPVALVAGRWEEAVACAKWYLDVFGSDFYLEIMDHGREADRVINSGLKRLGAELGIPLVATPDSHFTEREDWAVQTTKVCIQTGRQLEHPDEVNEGSTPLSFNGSEYLMDGAEMMGLFKGHGDLCGEDVAEALAESVRIADKCEDYADDLFKAESVIPSYPSCPDGEPSADYMARLAREGLEQRLSRVPPSPRTRGAEVYRERLEGEVQVLRQMGFCDYFLIVWDYIRYARSVGIPVGPGRGSAAGSVVAWALRITDIDPVQHGLLFERFINVERKSLPDIDTDFCVHRRDEVIKYVTEKYGAAHVAQIVTFNRLTSRAVLKDVGRVLGVDYSQSEALSQLVPIRRGKPTKLAELVKDATLSPEFSEKYLGSPSVKMWVDRAVQLEGCNKSYGVHAAGIVISDARLDSVIPLHKGIGKNSATVTQYAMDECEGLGLLKMDFLGLKNLTTIHRAVDRVRETDPEFAIEAIPEDDPATFALLAAGDLEGIFQLESSGMRSVVRELQPSNLEDIFSILALYRPGPLDAGLIPKFIARKHGRERIEYEAEGLEPILSSTYGILVYQEQIMAVAKELAGYTLGEADLLRRAMGKKKPAEMAAQGERFKEGCAELGSCSSTVADALFKQMVQFAEYCFNKSHSAAYGYLTYQTAYLKANYPREYMCELLNANAGDRDKLRRYIQSCKRSGIKVLPPDVNHSGVDFTPVGSNEIRFGLAAIKGVGEASVERILEVRVIGPFDSFPDFVLRCGPRRVGGKKMLEPLIGSGAMDELHPRGVLGRQEMIDQVPLVMDWANMLEASGGVNGEQTNVFDLLAEIGGEKGELAALHGTRVGVSSGGVPSHRSFEVWCNGRQDRPKRRTQRSESQGEESVESEVPLERVKSLDIKEHRLAKERELLGFYVSESPLDSIQPRIPEWLLRDTTDLAMLSEAFRTAVAPASGDDLFSETSSASSSSAKELGRLKARPYLVLAMVSELNVYTTKKKQEKMGVAVVEDLSGQSAQLVMFPKVWSGLSGREGIEDGETSLREGTVVITWCRADWQADTLKLIADRIVPAIDFRAVQIRLSEHGAVDTAVQERLKQVLTAHASASSGGKDESGARSSWRNPRAMGGHIPVLVAIEKGSSEGGQRKPAEGGQTLVRLGSSFNLSNASAALSGLRNYGFDATLASVVAPDEKLSSNEQ